MDGEKRKQIAVRMVRKKEFIGRGLMSRLEMARWDDRCPLMACGEMESWSCRWKLAIYERMLWASKDSI